MLAQIKDMKQECNHMETIFTQTYFDPRDAKQGFVTVITLSICYPLPTTSIKSKILQRIQIPVIKAVLSRLGFNNYMPCAIVFSLRYRGGLGLLDLYCKQGASQLKLIMSHI
jgi:hypothetical protein